jgi:hypothetical protein
MNKCQYCGKEFKTISSLNRHQTNVKYCLNIRNRKEGKESNNLICSYCSKKVASKYKVKDHLKICKVKKAKEIEKLQLEKERLEKEKEEIKLKEEIQELEPDIQENNEIEITRLRFEKEKYEADLRYKLDIERLQLEREKIKSKQENIVNLLKENIITFDQFEKLFSVIVNS